MKPSALSILLIAVYLFSCKEEETVVSGFALNETVFVEGETLQNHELSLQVEGEVHGPISIHYQLQAGTAKDGIDIHTTDGVLTFDSDHLSAPLNFEILGDDFFEITESCSLILDYEGRQFLFQLIIKDEDAVPAILEDEDGFLTPEVYRLCN